MLTMNQEIIQKHEDESVESYLLRLLEIKKENNWTWDTFAYYANKALDYNYSEKWYRTHSKRNDFAEYTKTCVVPVTPIDEKILSLKKEKIKLQDERIQNNAILRRMSREETLKDIARDYAEIMSREKKLSLPSKSFVYSDDDHAGIAIISDWHYGLEFSNTFNTYNPEVCVERVSQFTAEVIRLGELYNIKTLHLLNLSDLICGRIHLTLRLQSRLDVITQTMDVCEILAEMLTELSQHFVVTYRDVLDNHSRVEPKKTDSLELESMARMIPWYLRTRLTRNKNVLFYENDIAEDIIAFECCGHNIAAVHGHKDSPSKIVDNMITMTQRRNDLVLSAHLHHPSSEEERMCFRFSNGSLMGVDTYAENLRLTSRPSQTFIHITKDNVTDAIHIIPLN